MNRTPSAFAPGPMALVAMIALAALSRLLPHPPNFSPVAAMALFAGAYFASRYWALAVPMLAMLVSDLALGALNGGLYVEHLTSLPSLAVYACIATSSVLGFSLRGRVGGGTVLGQSLASSVLFFVVTNFAVWLAATPLSGHPACEAGIATCYAAALPFFQWTLLGTMFYAALLFGGFALLRHRMPGLRAQTV